MPQPPAAKPTPFKARFTSYAMAFGAIFLTVSMVLYPEVAFDAAVHGLTVWFEIVFPALLPFFIMSQILMGLGVVHFMGVLLEPFMRPVFNVAGAGSFVMAMGLASGYPIGSVLTAELRRKELVTRVEAERLMSFSNTADPLFMFGAVAVGMFGLAQVGAIIALSHYISTIMVGLVLRFYGRREDPLQADKKKTSQGSILVRSFQAMYHARVKDGRPFGQLIGDAIQQSVNSLLLIGGFIIIFSVAIRVATVVGVTATLSLFFARILTLLGFQPTLADACTSGLFEITIGSDLASSAANAAGPGLAPLTQRVAIASGIIAWSGLSVHCQVAAMVNDTDIRMGAYLFSRCLHAVLATIVALLMLQYGTPALGKITIPVFLQTPPIPTWTYWVNRYQYVGTRLGIAMLVLTLTSVAYYLLNHLRLIVLFTRKR